MWSSHPSHTGFPPCAGGPSGRTGTCGSPQWTSTVGGGLHSVDSGGCLAGTGTWATPAQQAPPCSGPLAVALASRVETSLYCAPWGLRARLFLGGAARCAHRPIPSRRAGRALRVVLGDLRAGGLLSTSTHSRLPPFVSSVLCSGQHSKDRGTGWLGAGVAGSACGGQRPQGRLQQLCDHRLQASVSTCVWGCGPSCRQSYPGVGLLVATS